MNKKQESMKKKWPERFEKQPKEHLEMKKYNN